MRLPCGKSHIRFMSLFLFVDHGESAQLTQEQLNLPLVFSSGSDGTKWDSRALVSFTAEHNFSRRCRADDEALARSLQWSWFYSVPREMCLPPRSPAAAAARMRFGSLLSQSAFPIRLNALWRRGAYYTTRSSE